MKEKVEFLQILSIILINVLPSKAECNVCSSINQMACVSETSYQFCVTNVPSGAVNSCPSGYVCSTATATICLPNAAGVVATCSECNKCDLNLVFACTGVNTYALCLGQTTPSTISTGTCGVNQVCNINSPQICASSSTTTATCPTGGSSSTTTTTTLSPIFTTPTTVPTYAQYYCNVMRMNRRFQIPSEFDSSCKRYIYCFRTTAGTWSGQIYTCAGSTYFDPVSLYCVASRPSKC